TQPLGHARQGNQGGRSVARTSSKQAERFITSVSFAPPGKLRRGGCLTAQQRRPTVGRLPRRNLHKLNRCSQDHSPCGQVRLALSCTLPKHSAGSRNFCSQSRTFFA